MEVPSTLPGINQMIESLLIYCVTCVVEGKNNVRKKEKEKERKTGPER
jgi:hypothetical protein